MPEGIVVLDLVVASAGAPVAVSTVVPKRYVRSVTITPKKSNSGEIYVGGSNVDANTCVAVLSSPAESFFWVSNGIAEPRNTRLSSIDLSTLFVDAEVNGDGVSVAYEEETP